MVILSTSTLVNGPVNMRVAELSAQTGVPVATIKYYLREGLLRRGHLTAPNNAEYDGSHVARLRLIRLLREVANTPVDRIRNAMTAIDDATISSHGAMAAVADALAPTPPPPGLHAAAVRDIVTRVIADAGWTRVRANSIDRENLRGVIEAIIGFATHEGRFDILAAYAQAADEIARFEVADLDGTSDRIDLISQMVVGQVLFGALLSTLRRLAEEHHSAARFEPGAPE